MKRSLLLGLAFVALTLALHFAPIWENMLNRGAETWDEKHAPRDYIESVIAAHSDGSDPAFARRPLTTWSIDLLSRFGPAPRSAFITIGLLGFFLAGLLVFRIALQLGADQRTALWSQALFLLSPTVIMAWFDPLYTYDEPIQYALLLAAVSLLLQQRWMLFVPVLFIALMARETSLLLLPALILIARRRRLAFFAALVATVVFAAWLAIAPQGTSAAELSADLARRTGYLAVNFSAERIGETIGFLVLVLALPLFLVLRHRTAAPPAWFRGFIVVLALNVPLVLVGGYAREARLFALPLILAWPWIGIALREEVNLHGGWTGLLGVFRSPGKAIALIGITVIVAICAYRSFVLTATWQQDNLFHEYLIAQLAFIAACAMASRRRVA
ncbi:MAG: hypothetical protein IPK70_10565 [Flavobacteriales bacterium]|jgi:hypothetical protein|nr:hypothetical protein [Flavobacteriales bacterium]